MRHPAIPTLYDGQHYRSRLEARWAAFFDLLDWPYTYEPLDGGGYIPDFLVHGPAPFFVEVKPAITRQDFDAEAKKTQWGLRTWDADLVIVGVSPIQLGSNVFGVVSKEDGYGNWNQLALWSGCQCGAVGWHAEEGHWRSRPCACYDGAHHLRGFDPRHIDSLWKTAGTLTRWPGSVSP